MLDALGEGDDGPSLMEQRKAARAARGAQLDAQIAELMMLHA